MQTTAQAMEDIIMAMRPFLIAQQYVSSPLQGDVKSLLQKVATEKAMELLNGLSEHHPF